MKHVKNFKLFEELNKKPEIGDYVIIRVSEECGTEEFQNKIGIIKNIINNTLLSIDFEDTNEIFHKSLIENISKNKEDLKILLQTKKYNL